MTKYLQLITSEFFPEIKNAKYVGSMFTVRVVPPRVEDTDERQQMKWKNNSKKLIFLNTIL